MDRTAPDLGPIMQILVPVADVDRAAEFYEHVLGLPLLFRYPGNAFFDADGVRLYLAQPTEPGLRRRASIYFRVDDVTATLERLEAARRDGPRATGDRLRDADYDLWLAFVRTPTATTSG